MTSLTRTWLKVCVSFLFNHTKFSVLAQLGFFLAWLGCDNNFLISIFNARGGVADMYLGNVITGVQQNVENQ